MWGWTSGAQPPKIKINKKTTKKKKKKKKSKHRFSNQGNGFLNSHPLLQNSASRINQAGRQKPQGFAAHETNNLFLNFLIARDYANKMPS